MVMMDSYVLFPPLLDHNYITKNISVGLFTKNTRKLKQTKYHCGLIENKTKTIIPWWLSSVNPPLVKWNILKWNEENLFYFDHLFLKFWIYSSSFMFVDPTSHSIFLRFFHKFSIFSGLNPLPPLFLGPQKIRTWGKNRRSLMWYNIPLWGSDSQDS